VDLGTVLDLVTAALIAVGLVLWRLVGTGAEHATKSQIDEVMAEVHRASTLARELEKTRGAERQELRFEAYGKLWAAMRPLAIYDDRPITAATTASLSKELSDWYFSEKGGLMLTTHNRDLYFALQRLLRAVSTKPDWQAERIDQQKDVFRAVVGERRLNLAAAQMLSERVEKVKVSDWPTSDIEELASEWEKKEVGELADQWAELKEGERFAVLQQTASMLRTGLANDVESRLR
jgi:hypothetical protein